MRLGDVTATLMTSQLLTSQQVPGSGQHSARWSIEQTEHHSVLTIADVTRRDSGLFVCYYVTSTTSRPLVVRVFRLNVSDDDHSTAIVQQGLLNGFMFVTSDELFEPRVMLFCFAKT